MFFSILRLLTFLSIFPSVSQASEYKIVRVIDGDTVKITAEFLPPELGNTLSLRIYGVDTPEKHPLSKCEYESEKATAATEFTKKILDNANSYKIIIKSWDKYGGRVIGDIIIDNNSLHNLLIENGFAKPYFGDKKESWCKNN